MIKNIIELSDKELEQLLTSNFSVIEKLDLIYFRLHLTKAGIFATKNSTSEVISDIDCLINETYKTINDFANKVEIYRDDIINSIGECRIGFFFNGVSLKTGKVEYRRDKISSTYNPPIRKTTLSNKNYSKENTFIISDLYTYSKPLNNKKNFLQLVKNLVNSDLMICEPPQIKEYEENSFNEYDIKKIKRCINLIKETSSKNAKRTLYIDLTHIILKGSSHDANVYASHNFSYVPSIILRNNQTQCKIPINDINYNLSDEEIQAKLIYRNAVLSSFASEMMKDNNLLQELETSNMSYIDKVSMLFRKFMDNTDVYKKYLITADDLIPPFGKYMLGAIDYSYLNEETKTKLAIGGSLYDALFRLLIHTCTKKISDNKFKNLPDNISEYLNKLIIVLKYKNYKQIAFEAYNAELK